MGFFTAPAPNPARALVIRFPARGVFAVADPGADAAAAEAGFDAAFANDDDTEVEAATDAVTDDDTTPGLSVNHLHIY